MCVCVCVCQQSWPPPRHLYKTCPNAPQSFAPTLPPPPHPHTHYTDVTFRLEMGPPARIPTLHRPHTSSCTHRPLPSLPRMHPRTRPRTRPRSHRPVERGPSAYREARRGGSHRWGTCPTCPSCREGRGQRRMRRATWGRPPTTTVAVAVAAVVRRRTSSTAKEPCPWVNECETLVLF